MDKLKNAIGLAKRAGQTVAGSELILETVKKHGAGIVLAACDASENSLKKLRNSCEFYKTKFRVIPLTKDELGVALGLERLTVAVAIKHHEILNLVNKALGEISSGDSIPGEM